MLSMFSMSINNSQDVLCSLRMFDFLVHVYYIMFWFLGIFLDQFCLNFVRNCWNCKFEWLNLYNSSFPDIFQETESIYSLENAI
jgi:hypothetical protein